MFLLVFQLILAQEEFFFRAIKDKTRINLHNQGVWFNKSWYKIYIFDLVQNIDQDRIKSICKNVILRTNL